jgi:hypothetical protein
MPKLSRRQLALAPLAASAQDGGKAYQGALDGFESKVDPVRFDPVAWTVDRARTAPLKMTFRASTPKDAAAWQRRLRAKITELIGGFPERTPLNPKLLESRDFSRYRREKWVLETRPGVSALVYLLIPPATAPRPAVVCVPGHGRGVDDIVGVSPEGRDRTDKSGYQHDFAIQAAEHGLAAAAIEPMGFGCRRDSANRRRGLGQSSCQPSAGAALLLGETMISWRVWDVMRTLDWLETKPEVDPKRFGCMGISGGGTCTLFAAALEPRIRAALVSGYLNTFADSIVSLSHCMDNYVPGILNWAEMYDVAGLIAPRAFFAESGEQDRIFPVEAARQAFARVRNVYAILGAPDQVRHEVFPAEHVFHGALGLPFLAQQLSR